jgi:hypothetical protein
MRFEKWSSERLLRARSIALIQLFGAFASGSEWLVNAMLLHLNALYFEDKKFCRLDVGTKKTFTHPSISASLFIDDIKDRNRLQANRQKILQTNNFKWARSIHPIIAFSIEDIVKDLDIRIKEIENRIEHFHANYIL